MKKYEQIYWLIIRQIQSGEKAVGSKLPSVRQMAKLNQVSKNTILEAYDRLVAERYIVSQPGSGFYVAPGIYNQYYQNISMEFHHAYERIDLLKRQLIQESDYKPGDGRYPRKLMSNLNIDSYLGEINRQSGLVKKCLDYGDPLGYSPLQNKIIMTMEARGLVLENTNIMMTSGTNHSYDLIIRHFLNKGDKVIVEAPGYYPLFSKLELSGIDMLSISREGSRIDPEYFQYLVEKYKPKIFFLQPYVHNPTGTDLDDESIEAIRMICSQHHVIVVEDDPFFLLREGAASKLLNFADDTFAVIYLGSFSKTFSASLRCGWIIASKLIIQSLLKLKVVTSVNTSSIVEAIVYDLLMSDAYEPHVRNLKQQVRKQALLSTNALKTVGLYEMFKRNPVSFYIWCHLPEKINEEELVRKAQANNIFLAPGTLFFAGRSCYSAIRFNVFYSNDQHLISFLQNVW